MSFSPYHKAQSRAKQSEVKKEVPTKIRSDIMDIKRKSQIIDFFGNVIVEKEDSSLLADEMRVLYEERDGENPNRQQSSIKRIDAKENVKIFSEEFIATGDFGHYDPKQNIFVLKSNVIVNNGVSIASGDRFIYDIKAKKGNFVGRTNKALIDSNSDGDKRVIVVIGNGLEDKKKSQKVKAKKVKGTDK